MNIQILSSLNIRILPRAPKTY